MVVLDTNVLIDNPLALTEFENIILPFVVIEELDNLKTKEGEVGYHARKAIHLIDENITSLRIDPIRYRPWDEKQDTADNQIIMCAKTHKNAVLYSNDLAVRLKAKLLFDIDARPYCTDNAETELYKGYIEAEICDEDWEAFVLDGLTENKWGLIEGQYLIMKSFDVPKAVVHYKNGEFLTVDHLEFSSKMLGSIRAKDLYQMCAFDSLVNNDVTFLLGKAGSGKTLLSLHYLLGALEDGTINRIYIIHNGIKTKDASEIGFLPGTLIEKMLNGTSLGSILTSKFGGAMAIEKMIFNERLVIVPASQIRGLEIRPDEALYISEAQNMSPYLMKTSLQRVADGAKAIIEGDVLEQADLDKFAHDNGFKKAIEQMKGHPRIGIVKLKEVYRSWLTKLADTIE